MIRTVQISLLLLLTSISSFSQNTYPKRIIAGKDTIIAITQDQLKTTNCLLEEREIYRQGLDSAIVFFAEDLKAANELSAEKNRLIVLYKDQLLTKDKRIDNSEKTINLLAKEIKAQKSKTTRSTIGGAIISSLVTAITVLLIK
jgi:hypothetical protein